MNPKTTINWFEHVEKGEVPRIFGTRMGGKITPVPGDSLFAEIEVDGLVFACTIVSQGGANVSPGAFELAIRSVLAGLCEHTDSPQAPGVYVVSEGDVN